MSGGPIELRDVAGGYVLVRATEWRPGIPVRQPGVVSGVVPSRLHHLVSQALREGGAAASALVSLAGELEGVCLAVPGQWRGASDAADIIMRGVERRRVLAMRFAALPGARDASPDPLTALREADTGTGRAVQRTGANVASMDFGERCLFVLQAVPRHISEERVREEFAAAFTPETLALTAAALGVMMLNPAGMLALLLGGLLLGVSLLLAGQAVMEGCAQAAEAFERTRNARSEADLDAAAAILAAAIVALGVGLFLRLVARAAPRRRRGPTRGDQGGGSGGGNRGGGPDGGTPPPRPPPPPPRRMTADPRQVQAKYKHAQDFGLPPNYTPANGRAFEQAMQNHVQSPNTQQILGSYGRGAQPTDVIHYYDPATKLNVMTDRAGNFLSGWKLSPAQERYLLTTGRLGGG
jgi:hypothetical protein